MEKVIELVIDDKLNGLLVKAVLSKQLGLSRREISRLKFNNGILVNEETCRVTQVLNKNDTLKVIFPEVDAIHLGYLPEKPNIIYEDDDLVIVNKPAGMPCHPSHEHQGDDMGSLLQNYYGDKPFTIRAVGRLDKDVSGIMCYAKNQPSAARLTKQRKENIFHKEYLAIVSGILDKKKDTFTYRLKKVNGQKRRVISDDGQLCITNYEVVKEFDDYSLVKVDIVTGRTHQIRAGFSYLGHPLLGDSLYGGKSNKMMRVALHCAHVSFKQPFTHKMIDVEAQLPKDMKQLVEK